MPTENTEATAQASTAVVAFSGKSLQELQAAWIATRNATLKEAVKVVKVDTTEELAIAGAVEAQAKKLIKQLGDERMKITKPLDDIKKQIMDAEKVMIAKLDTEARRINIMTVAYATKQMLAEREAQRKREQEEREAAEAAAAEATRLEHESAQAQALAEEMFGPGAVSEAVVEPVQVEKVNVQAAYVEMPRTSTNSFGMVFKFEVTDPAKVAREFLSVDESKIREFLKYRKTQGDTAKTLVIDGVRVWEEASVKSR